MENTCTDFCDCGSAHLFFDGLVALLNPASPPAFSVNTSRHGRSDTAGQKTEGHERRIFNKINSSIDLVAS